AFFEEVHNLMKFQINLSRRPFYNRKLFWLGFFVAMSMVGLLSAWTFRQTVRNDSEIERLQSEVAQRKRRLKELESQPVKGAQALSDSQIEQLQAAAVLIEERTFSWTAMLEEFEQYLSPEIRINSIAVANDKLDPETLAKGIPFSMKVFAKSPEDVTKLIARLDKDNVFRVEPKAQLAPTPTGEIGFELGVNYLPRKRRPASAKAKPKTVKEVSEEE